MAVSPGQEDLGRLLFGSLRIGGRLASGLHMDSAFRRALNEPLCLEETVVQQGIERCQFLRNINEPTSFSFSSINFPVPVCPLLPRTTSCYHRFKVSDCYSLWYAFVN